MPSFLSATWLLFRTHLSRAASSRRTLACLALAACPPALAWIAVHLHHRIPAVAVVTHVGWMLLLQVIVPLLALVSGSAVITEEIEDRTITYLFSRPIPRPAVLLGRWLAVLCLVSVLLALSVGLTIVLASTASGAGAAVDIGIGLPLLEAALLGGAVYSGLFAAAGVFFRHPMIVGLGYSFAVEGFLANLPGRNQALTLQHYLRSFVVSTGSDPWRAIRALADPHPATAQVSVLTLLLVLVLGLSLACWRISRREFVLSA